MRADITKELLEQKYLVEKKSFQTIADELDASIGGVWHLAQKWKIPSRSNIKYSKDDKYFSIANVNNCYWAGVIASDGCVFKNSLQFAQSSKDFVLLEAFVRDVKYNGVIADYESKGYAGKTRSYSHLRISNAGEWIADLSRNWNITPSKSLTLKPPNINQRDEILSFIVGYIDGNGGMYMNGPVLDVQIASGSMELITWIQEEIAHWMNCRKGSIRAVKNAKCNVLRYYSDHAFQVVTELMKIHTPFRLDRKWDKVKLYKPKKPINIQQ